MQKQGKSNCPMCRSPCVHTADRCKWFSTDQGITCHIFNTLTNPLALLANVDWALMNFMADWFPVESREKLLANGREASAELERELGFDKNRCLIM